MLPDKISRFKSRIRSRISSNTNLDSELESGLYIESDSNPRLYLHSRRRYLINSIPLLSIVALLVGVMIIPTIPKVNTKHAHAYFDYSDNTNTSTSPSISLAIAQKAITSNPTAPGDIATANTSVSVNVSNAESYSLILKVNEADLTNGATTLKAGNAITDNTWGYKWDKDNVSTYKAPSISGTTLTTPPLTNNSVSFNGTLAFAAKFSNNATPGVYHASGTLSLTATPKKITAKWSNGTDSGITYMQDIQSGFCDSSIPINSTIKLKDKRDEKEYTIAKMVSGGGDGKCWMSDNLKLQLSTNINLTENDSNVSNTGWTPAENTMIGTTELGKTTLSFCGNNFYSPNTSGSYRSCYSRAQSYASTINADTYYYTFNAATANSATSLATGSTDYSICPKGWHLPSGGDSSNTTTDFYRLFVETIGIGTLNSGQATVSSTMLTAIQSTPYNFTKIGYIHDGAVDNSSSGFWWSNAIGSIAGAYALNLNGTTITPGTISHVRYIGAAVRCIANV